MEPNVTEGASIPIPTVAPMMQNPVVEKPLMPEIRVCQVCHQSLMSSYYYCPNCGTKVGSGALSTSIGAQLWLYVFSIILPMMGFLFITRWQGMKYFRSPDKKTNQIGQVAWALIILSTIVTIWAVVVWTQNYIKQTQNDLNSSMSGYGTF